MTASVSIRNLTRTFATFKALDDVWLDIAAGEFIVLLGPSGCGKTTLLSILGGFLTPTSGTVKIGDRDMAGVPPARRPTTTMFQDYALFPHMRLIDNVGFGLRMRGMDRASREAKAASFLDLVGLKSSARKKPHELFGLGLVRTFQIAQEFSNMPALENLMMVPARQTGESLLAACLRWGQVQREEAALRQRAEDVIAFLRLGRPRELLGAIVGGQVRRLRAIGLGPLGVPLPWVA